MHRSLIVSVLSLIVLAVAFTTTEAGLFRQRCQARWTRIPDYLCPRPPGEDEREPICQWGNFGEEYQNFCGTGETVEEAQECAKRKAEEYYGQPNPILNGDWFPCYEEMTDECACDDTRQPLRWKCKIVSKDRCGRCRYDYGKGESREAALRRAILNAKLNTCLFQNSKARCYRVVRCVCQPRTAAALETP